MSYTVNPLNYSEIEKYVYEYSKDAQRKIIISKRCFVIDSCAIEYFKKKNRVEKFAEYLKFNGISLIVFRTILMELSGDRGVLDAGQINFFRILASFEVETFLLYEEDLFSLLSIYTSKQKINEFLKRAVLCVKGPVGTLNRFLETNNNIKNAIVRQSQNAGDELFSSFWKGFRQSKVHKDDLGEIACAICIHILANMEDINKYKYVFSTEDKAAITIMHKVINNCREYQASDNKNLIGIATSSKIIEEMYNNNILKTSAEIENFCAPYTDTTRIKATIKGQFDIELREISFTITDFVSFIVNKEGIIFC